RLGRRARRDCRSRASPRLQRIPGQAESARAGSQAVTRLPAPGAASPPPAWAPPAWAPPALPPARPSPAGAFVISGSAMTGAGHPFCLVVNLLMNPERNVAVTAKRCGRRLTGSCPRPPQLPRRGAEAVLSEKGVSMPLHNRIATAAVALASVTAAGLTMTPAASAAPAARPAFLAHFH